MALGVNEIKSLLKPGSVGNQLFVFGVLTSVMSQLLSPPLQLLLQDIYKIPGMQATPLGGADIADMVERGVFEYGAGSDIPQVAFDEAQRTGLTQEQLSRLVGLAGEPPAIGDLAEAKRRGIIDDARLVKGIKQSRLRNEWIDVIEALQIRLLTVADAVEGKVKSQISDEEALSIAQQNGITPHDFTTLVNTAGNPPGPQELAQLANRGEIPWEGTGPDVLSYQQGIYEGRTKNKWEPTLRKLAEYLPPPRTVTALERQGAISPETAQALYAKHGLTPELAAVYSHSATTAKTSKAHQLAESQLLKMYEEHILSADEVTQGLSALNYSQHDIDSLLLLTDMSRVASAMTKAVEKLHTQFVARKLGKEAASNALDSLGLPPQQRDSILGVWATERQTTVKVLTEAQIVSAFANQIVDQPTAIAYLEALGYSLQDAVILLGIKEKGPITPTPEQPATVPETAQ